MTDYITRRRLAMAASITGRATLASLILATTLAPLIAPSVGYHTQPTQRVSDKPIDTPPTQAIEPVDPRPPTPAVGNASDNEYTPMCRNYGENGLSIEESAHLFSRDRDLLNEEDTLTKQEYTTRCGHEPTPVTNRTLEFDFTSPQALSAVSEWNRGDISNVPYNAPTQGKVTVSTFPRGQPTIDVGAIRDATATLYSLSPSVGLRDMQGEETAWLLRGETTIRGAQSYRLERPDDLIDDPTGPRRTYYTVEGEAIGSCLLQGEQYSEAGVRHENRTETLCVENDPLAATASIRGEADPGPEASRISTLEFEYSEGTAEELSYVSTFRADIMAEERICGEWNETTDSCDGLWIRLPERPVRSYYTSAVDEFSAEYYAKPTPTAEVASFPSGDTEFVLTAQGRDNPRLTWRHLFSEVQFQGDSRIGWGWRVFSARRPEWEYLVTRSADVRGVSESPTHPLQNYAVPIAAKANYDDAESRALATSSDISIEEIRRTSHPRRPPSIDDTILLGTPQPEYREPYAVHYRSEGPLDFAGADVVGLLEGTSTTGIDVERRVEMRNTLLDVETSDAEGDKLRVLVTVEGVIERRSGKNIIPLQTEGTERSVTVNGKRVETNASGQAVVLVEEGTTVDVAYHPVAWTAHDRETGYVANATYFRTTNFGSSFIITMISELFMIFFPFILVMFTLRSIRRKKTAQR